MAKDVILLGEVLRRSPRRHHQGSPPGLPGSFTS